MAKDEQVKPQDEPKQEEELDTEGHNIFATQVYYTQRNIDRKSEIDRDVRDRARAKEAEASKKNKR